MQHRRAHRGGTPLGARDRRSPLLLAVLCIQAVVCAGVSSAAVPAVNIDGDGTVHVPAQTVPASSLLSPQARSYLREHLQIVTRHPELMAPENGVPRYFKHYLERQRTLYPVVEQDSKIGGVHVLTYTPKVGVSARNRDRVLITLHGGGFGGCWPGCGELESIPIAALGRITVISVDYREAPEARFPAASEDVAAVYRALLQTHRRENIGIYGCSAGGMLTAMAMAWFQRHDLPNPGAIGIFCSGAGAQQGSSFGGDSERTVLPLSEGRMSMPAPLAYLAGTDPRDPLVAPINSPKTLARFPPTLIVTGTRAFDFSASVYTHGQLVRAGVPAQLNVWEGLMHAFFYNPDIPESRDCYDVIVRFFDRRLGT